MILCGDIYSQEIVRAIVEKTLADRHLPPEAWDKLGQPRKN